MCIRDRQYTEQWNALDLIAERIRALGFPAPGTYKEFVSLDVYKRQTGHCYRQGI